MEELKKQYYLIIKTVPKLFEKSEPSREVIAKMQKIRKKIRMKKIEKYFNTKSRDKITNLIK